MILLSVILLIGALIAFIVEAIWHRSLIALGLALWVLAVILQAGLIRVG